VSEAAEPQVDANPRYRQVARLPGVLLYENTTALPRGFVVPEFATATFPDDARIIEEPGFDLHRHATLEAPAPAAAMGGTGTARFTSYSPNHLDVTASTNGPALLVLSEAWYPGWEAHLDGKPVPIYIADAAFRGIIVPAGTHQLRMDFRPRILLYSAAISLVFLVGLAILYTFPLAPVKQ
jgi:hypothetical protein